MSTAALSIDVGHFRAQLAKVEASIKFTPQGLQELADFAVHQILRRTTEQGLDYKDYPFYPYSKKYGRKRVDSGRNLAPVDLTFRGLMIASLTGGVEGNDTIRLYFKNADDGRIANYHNSLEPRKKMPFRRFLDFAPGTSVHKAFSEMAIRVLVRTLAN